jgi:hypothetical protein
MDEESRILANWKTSVGASVGGFFLAAFLTGIIDRFSTLSTEILFGALIAEVVFWGIGIWYALAYYPSLFNKNCTRTASSATISFMNLFFGGIIFGCIWNSNLTKKTKGVSNVVFAVLDIIIAACVLIVTFLTI